jgi:hypothetical protein
VFPAADGDDGDDGDDPTVEDNCGLMYLNEGDVQHHIRLILYLTYLMLYALQAANPHPTYWPVGGGYPQGFYRHQDDYTINSL